MNFALILAAGSGSRMGNSDRPKHLLYSSLDTYPLFKISSFVFFLYHKNHHNIH